ncbi:MAG: hypothetical protein IJ863_00605 [Spirochaetales bacterium]|nr:hypothetical protein [Spirochaetales bacterium]
MIKTLVKKQLFEMHRSFFYDYRRNRAKSKRGTILSIAGYVFIMVVVLGGLFGSMSAALAGPLVASGMGWFYFLITGGVAILYGAFGSVFNTFSTLYLSKDNDLLLSMPIPIRNILASRLLGVYFMGWMYSSVVMIPAIIFYYINAPLHFLNILGPIVYYMMITLIVLDLSTGLGWVVAKLSTKLKNKAIVRTIMVLIGLALYYVVYFRAINAMNDFVARLQTMVIDTSGPIHPFYLFSRTGEGNPSSMVVVSVVVIALTVGIYLLLDKTFIKIVTTKTGTTRVKYKAGKAKARSVGSALLRKEFKRLTSSSTYLLNCALGTVLMAAAAVMLIIKGGMLYPAIEGAFGSDLWDFIYMVVPALMCFVLSMNDTTAPSISMEGKGIWIAQSLPVRSIQILNAKKNVQLILTLPMASVLAIVFAVQIHMPVVETLLVLVLVALIELVLADFGLYMNLKRPNLNWVSEAMVVKQGISIVVALFSGWIYGILIAATGYFMTVLMPASLALVIWIAITAVPLVLMERWLRRKGTRIFENL